MLKNTVLVAAATLLGFVATTAYATSGKRYFAIAAIEPKGGANVDKEPFPSQAVPEGGGFILKEPNAEGRWEMAAYIWSAPQIHVTEGDEVTLDFVGINGAAHPTTIEGYDQAFTLQRGQVKSVTFTANKPGVFKIICTSHKPTMVSELIVSAKQ